MQPPYYLVFARRTSRVLFELADYHGKEGIVRRDAIEAASSGEELETHLHQHARIFHATATDVIESFRNGPQNVTLKDAAYIIGRCGITRSSSVIEAGTGSGSLTAFLSLYAGSVVSFEAREDFHELASQNLRRLSSLDAVGDVELVLAPFEEALERFADRIGSFDACVLDMPEPWSCYAPARAMLRAGGLLVCYVPNATQASRCSTEASDSGFEPLESVELIRREWRFSERIAKPGKEVLHTAFLLFFRKRVGEHT